MNMLKDYYEILEVHPKASSEIIKKAYIALAKRYHPDTSTLDKKTAEEKIKLLNEAYAVLSNDDARREYDKQYISKYRSDAEEESNQHSDQSIHADPFVSAAENIVAAAEKAICRTGSVIHRNEYSLKNKELCDNIIRDLYSEISYSFKTIQEAPDSIKAITLDHLGVAFWAIGVAYTWGNSFIDAEESMIQASSLIIKGTDTYDRFFKAYSGIKASAANQKNQEEEIKRNTKPKQTISACSIVYFVIAIIAIIGFISSGSTSKQKPASPSSTVRQTAKESKALTPKHNVLTRYEPNTPILNNKGYSELLIDNSKNSVPVYVRVWYLTNQQKPVRTFTINSNEKFTAKDLSPGKYEIRYKFLYEEQEATIGLKSEPFTLSQTDTGSGIRYSEMSLTLYKVKNGNTKTFNIPIESI